MFGVCRIGVDYAGGKILGMKQDGSVFANGSNIAVNLDRVEAHGSGTHSSAVMVASCNNAFINGIMVCNAKDKSTCEHEASGSSNVFIGEKNV